MPETDIIIKGAREHNLRNVDAWLPRNRLICLTGVSGSGKSSLAFDTLYAEGQRRYMEALSTYARQFLGQMPKPEADSIVGLSPSISISQKSAGNNPRSTVGTITEIYDFLRVLFARVGQAHCPKCGDPVAAQSREAMLAQIMRQPAGKKIMLLAPRVRGQKGHYRDLFEELLRHGFVRARVNGEIIELADPPELNRNLRHHIEVVVDRLVIGPDIRTRLAESVDLALKQGEGTFLVASPDTDEADLVFSSDYACARCGIGFEPPSPQLFSFNSPHGMCPECGGMGELFTFDPDLLVPNPALSFKKGAIELLGNWKAMGRWRRHIFQGVADTIERVRSLPPGTMLDTPWAELPEELRDVWLRGTGSQHITFTWRGGASPMKYGGKFEGIIAALEDKHRQAKSVSHRRKLEAYMRTIDCPSCRGERLCPQARAVTIRTRSARFSESPEKTLPQVCQLSIEDAAEYLGSLELNELQEHIAGEVLKETRLRLQFLLDVGLDYLALDRTAPTLSGGESQRIRLASQVGCGLVGVLYILDEPSIGLHPRDNQRLLDTLSHLRDLGNTVVVVEHDEATMRAADHIIDFGPGAGVRGGEIVASGTPEEIATSPRSVTGQFLTGSRKIEFTHERRSGKGNSLKVIGAAHNNLKHIDVEIPLGKFVCVTGVSGSGKSSLVNDIIAKALHRDLNRGEARPGRHERIEGLEFLDKLIAIDQSPIGRTPRSNPGTYIKAFDEIRKLFAQLPDSKQRGYKAGRFSFNVSGGRCEPCQGNGATKLEMDFLADVWVTCPACRGHRYNRETLEVKFKGYSIADILEMDVQQLLEIFENVPTIRRRLQTLHDVGLDYIKLGQPSPTLSGGEAQRIKLARELSKRSTGKTLYLLDEPTTGLHFADIDMLLRVLHGFVDDGNTVLVVEHNLDVIKTADWIIDLGPEGGAGGGFVVAEGTPEKVAKSRKSATAPFLAEALGLKQSRTRGRRSQHRQFKQEKVASCRKLRVQGAEQHNLQHVDVTIPRDALTVFCGPSGSGKTSLAMDTIYAEGQRRYVESLSAYARQFVSQMPKPRIEHVEGLSPAVAIEQRNLGHTPRSTVGTVTEVYDYLRVLMSRLGEPYCPTCDEPARARSVDEIVDEILKWEEGTRLFITAPFPSEDFASYDEIAGYLQGQGFLRVRINQQTTSLERLAKLPDDELYDIDVVVDRVIVRANQQARIADSVETAMALGNGVVKIVLYDEQVDEAQWQFRLMSHHLMCEKCGEMFERLAPHHFSFNHPRGWCSHCEGLGVTEGAPLELVVHPERSLQEGALRLWPGAASPLGEMMLQALCGELRIPMDRVFSELSPAQQSFLLYGTGDRWFAARSESGSVCFEFQYKGAYGALEEGARKSYSLRQELYGLLDTIPCPYCAGSRLRPDAAAMRFQDLTIGTLCHMPLKKLMRTIDSWKLRGHAGQVARDIVGEIKSRLQFLLDVGLDYLTLDRGAATLSNGEAQRIRLASQLGSGLCGVLYVLDEPTIGLHPRDNARLIRAMHRLRDLGNTLLVVEHDREVIASADRVLDFGPGAGRFGGRIIAEGTVKQLARRRASVTGPYLKGTKGIPVPRRRRMTVEGHPTGFSGSDQPEQSAEAPGEGWLVVRNATHHNLRNIDAAIPLGTLTVVVGPSGSGKSSLVDGVLYPALAHRLHHAMTSRGAHDRIDGIEYINKVIRVDQQPLGNSPASNPATYTGLFELIRRLYAELPESRVRGYSARQFSFNVSGGRCEACEGNGKKKIEMHFLPDVWVPCEDCEGRRYKPETLAITYRGRSIYDVLEMTIGEARELFSAFPKLTRILQTLCDVGLDYLSLGQAAPTLSGGEAQRVKLAAELARPDTGRTLYLLDEPTTGLHFDDLQRLLQVLHRLVELGNTVVLIEHNLDVIKTADWLLELGPEAGREGGRLVVSGTPEQVVAYAESAAKSRNGALRSWTGEALAPVLEAGPFCEHWSVSTAEPEQEEGGLDISDVGKEVRPPWEVDGRKWHLRDRVGRNGEPVHWEAKILETVVEKILACGEFGEVNWNARSVVEIAGPVVSRGWFFHAITAEPWLLKMKFRVPAGRFKNGRLSRQIPLPTLNQMDEIPMYGNQPRVKCTNVNSEWDEVQVQAYTFEEIDQPGFWDFLEQAAGAFLHKTQDAFDVEAETPWKKLGEKWHFMDTGFRRQQKPKWPMSLWKLLYQDLVRFVPDGKWIWTNRNRVHLEDESGERLLTVVTKNPESLDVILYTSGGVYTYGELSQLRVDVDLRRVEGGDDWYFYIRSLAQYKRSDFRAFLERHLSYVSAEEQE